MAGEPPQLSVGEDAGFDVELVDEPPGGPRALAFAGADAGMADPADAFELRVTPSSAPSWVGRFETGYPSPAAVTVVRDGPHKGQLLVVNRGAGFLVPVADPASAVELAVSPIVAVLVSDDPPLVLAADFTTLSAFDATGRRWSEEVSWDGVELHDIAGGIVRGRGWDAPSARHVAFEVDLATGRSLRGVTPRPA